MILPALLRTPRDRAAALAVVLLFLVPAVLLLVGPKPSRFSFQMYSGYGQTSASWTDAEGGRHPVLTGRHVANPRVEVDWTTFLPEELCDRIAGAVSVEVRRTQPHGDQRRTVPC